MVFHLGRLWRVRAWRIRTRAYSAAERCDKGHCVATEVRQFLNRTPYCTGLRIYALPSFCSKPQLLDLASPHKPGTRGGCDNKERDCQRESEKCPSSQSLVSTCVPLEAIPTQSSQIRGGLRDGILVHPLLVLLIFPTYSMSQWKLETEIWLGARCPSPCHKILPSVRSPSQQVYVHSL